MTANKFVLKGLGVEVAARGSNANARLCRNAGSRDGGLCQELAAGISAETCSDCCTKQYASCVGLPLDHVAEPVALALLPELPDIVPIPLKAIISNLVGSSTGTSAGLSPLRMRPA
jgi:hypothetical protein